MARRIHPDAEEFAPVGLHGDPFDLGAAPINADEHSGFLR
jgi:hypothetical protein